MPAILIHSLEMLLHTLGTQNSAGAYLLIIDNAIPAIQRPSMLEGSSFREVSADAPSLICE